MRTIPFTPTLIGAEIAPFPQRKCDRSRPGHRSYIRNLTILAYEITRLHRDIHLGRRFLQVVQDLCPILKLGELCIEQLWNLLLSIVVEDV